MKFSEAYHRGPEEEKLSRAPPGPLQLGMMKNAEEISEELSHTTDHEETERDTLTDIAESYVLAPKDKRNGKSCGKFEECSLPHEQRNNPI